MEKGKRVIFDILKTHSAQKVPSLLFPRALSFPRGAPKKLTLPKGGQSNFENFPLSLFCPLKLYKVIYISLNFLTYPLRELGDLQ